MLKKITLPIMFIFMMFVSNPLYSAENSNSTPSLKDEAYNTISEALFDKKIHASMKMDIFSVISDLALGSEYKEENQDIISEFYQDLISDSYNSSFNISVLDQQDQQQDNNSTTEPKEPKKVDTGIITLLRKIINSEEPNMVLYGLDIISKAKIKDFLPEITEKLEKCNPDDIEMKASLLSTIGSIGNESSIAVLKKYLDDPEMRIRLNTLQSISEIDSSSSESILKGYLKSDSLELALLSAGILAEKGDSQAINLLKEGIESPVMLTQQKTMIAMTNVKNPLILPVIKLALKVNNDIVKTYALNVLACINTEESARIISTQLDNETFMPRALIALTKNTSEEAYKVFEKFILSNDVTKKSYTLAVLSQIKDKRVIPILKLALNDKNENIRVTAAKILDTLGDKTGIQVLREATKSDNDNISISSASYLGYRGDAAGKSILERAVSDTDLPSWQRLDISIILDKLNDGSITSVMKPLLQQQRPNSLPKDLVPTENTLKKLLSDDSNWVRLNTTVFMTKTKNIECLPTLEELSNDPDNQIRTVVVGLLGKLDTTKALPILQKHLKDDSVRVRVTSADSILKIISQQQTN